MLDEGMTSNIDSNSTMEAKTFGPLPGNCQHHCPPVAFPPPPPPPPHVCPTHGFLSPNDWMRYINQYIDVRARQIYDKLKALIKKQETPVDDSEKTFDRILLRDEVDGKVYMLTTRNGVLCTRQISETVPEMEKVKVKQEDGSEKIETVDDDFLTLPNMWSADDDDLFGENGYFR